MKDEHDKPPHAAGRCYGLGVGPGDPELITVKAQRILRSCPAVAYFSAAGRSSNALRVVEQMLIPDQELIHLVYPMTTEPISAGVSYDDVMRTFYDESAETLAEVLSSGRDVAVLCEGDPFFHGSFMYVHNRLGDRFLTEVVPGVTSMQAGAAVLGTPLVCLDEVLNVVSGTLPPAELRRRLEGASATVVMKIGRHLEKVRRAVAEAGLLDRAWYVERATMADQRILPLKEVEPQGAPYFSLIVIPSLAASQR
jgi:precorrin-2/cobalt-factor-2 C20-methyltransferase